MNLTKYPVVGITTYKKNFTSIDSKTLSWVYIAGHFLKSESPRNLKFNSLVLLLVIASSNSSTAILKSLIICCRVTQINCALMNED